MSASDTQMPCAASTPAPRKPRPSRYATGDDARRSCATLVSSLRLRQVDQRRHVVTLRQFSRGPERRTIQRVDGVRRDGRRNQRIALERR